MITKIPKLGGLQYMKVRVLVIDDDEDILYIANRYLSKEDPHFEIHSVRNSQDALRELDETAFDAVLCDFHLGKNEMNGLEILEWMRGENIHTPLYC